MSCRLTKLKNGVTILTVPQPEALSVSVMILADAGSKDENEKNSGISHFLEHMGFKGTVRRPRTMDLSSEFDALGASYNAFTVHDSTAYYVTVIPDKIEPAVDLLADMYLHSTYPEEELSKERGVIIEEIKLYEDQPTSFVWDVFSKLAYAGTSAGRLIIGDRETVSNITRENLLAYRDKHYSATATIVIVVGNFDEESMVKLLSEKFSSLLTGEKKNIKAVTEDQAEPRIELSVRPIEQSHIVLGFKSVSLFDDRFYPLTVLASVLGGGMSSRLFQKIREELGAAYYIGAGQFSHMDHGYLAVYSGVDAPKLNLVVGAIMDEIKKIKTEIISEAELRRVKDRLVGNLFLGLETPSDQTYFYGEQAILREEILSLKQYVEKIRAVTAEELKTLAEEIFQPAHLSLAIVGPDCPLEEIKGIINSAE
ncbi:MAG: pitrilysin family protein [Candidatus Paceibacterota bacterium]|jgi:predicted Zn-dependent peptidase